MTIVLTRSTVDRLLPVEAATDALRAGFLAPAADEPPVRIRTDLPGPGTATCLMPGLLPGVPAYTVKVNAKFPGAVPALRGTLPALAGPDRVSVYAPVGLPWQDLALTWLLRQRATAPTVDAPVIDLLG